MGAGRDSGSGPWIGPTAVRHWPVSRVDFLTLPAHAPMTLPRLSILLPTWNGERDLERLLPALASQEYAGGARAPGH